MAAQRARADAESMEKKRSEAIREYEFDTRKKQWKRRLGHLKALCVVIILSYGESPSKLSKPGMLSLMVRS